MNRRSFFAALASAAALAIPGLALSSCAPKRFPWPGVTRAWTSEQITVFASQLVRTKWQDDDLGSQAAA